MHCADGDAEENDYRVKLKVLRSEGAILVFLRSCANGIWYPVFEYGAAGDQAIAQRKPRVPPSFMGAFSPFSPWPLPAGKW